MMLSYVMCILLLGNSVSAGQVVRPLVRMKDVNQGHTMVGGDIQLECETTFNMSYVSIRWYKGEEVIDTDMSDIDIVLNQTNNTSKLTIRKSQLYHADRYKCEVVHKKWEDFKASDSIQVHVWEGGDYRLEFKSFDLFPKGASEITAEIVAHPNISVVWRNNKNRVIPSELSSAFDAHRKLKSASSNYYVKVPFEALSYEDFGKYTVIAKNEYVNKSQSVSVDLSKGAVMHLSLESVDEDTRTGTFKCVAISYPKPVIKWALVNCDILTETCYLRYWEDRVEKELQESRYEENGLQVTSYVSVDMSVSGYLKCKNHDLLNGMLVFHIKDGFLIAAKGIIKRDNKTQIIYHSYEESVSLICAVTLYNYTAMIKLYHNGKFLTEDHDDDLVTINYIVHPVFYRFENDIGNFTFEVLTRTGEVEGKTVQLVPKVLPNLYPKILVQDLNHGHTVAGGLLKLRCQITYHKKVTVEWLHLKVTWRSIDKKADVVTEPTAVESNVYVVSNELTFSANTSHAGYYRCRPRDENGETFSHIWDQVGQDIREDLWVSVSNVNDSFIKFDKELSVFDSRKKEIRVFIKAHPEPSIKWYSKSGKEIASSDKFFTTIEPTSKSGGNNYVASLNFKNISFEDTGNYTLMASNKYQKEVFSISVNVTGLPSVSLHVHTFNEETMTAVVKCTSVAYPKPALAWYFQKCTTWKFCLPFSASSENAFIQKKELKNETVGLESISYISVNLTERGLLRCLSKNSFGKAHKDEPILYVEKKFDIFEDTFNVQDSRKMVEVVGYAPIRIMCIASIYHYGAEMAWYFNNHKSNFLKYSKNYEHEFLFAAVSILDTAERETENDKFTCNILTKKGFLQSRTLLVRRREISFLTIRSTNIANKSVQVELGKKCSLYCYVTGFPTPKVRWFRNNHLIQASKTLNIFSDGQVLEIAQTGVEDEGTYMCEVTNGYEVLANEGILKLTRKLNWYYIVVPVVLLVLVMSVLIATVYFKLKKHMKLLKESGLADLAYFEEGNLANLNPHLPIEQQADLLPYDRKWEIPSENIKIGKQLGSGTFGVVFEAEVVNIFPGESTKTVAVKTVNPNSGFDCIRSLASELKIMAHLGKHVNIVNLLGACTRNIAKKQFYVIVEYCHYGNLQEYVRRYSKNFVDQKNYESDEFDWTIGSDGDSNEFHKSGYLNMQRSQDLVKFSDNFDNQQHPGLCSKDLLVWSFQVSRGMEYLSSRRIVHGDLAARNILLSVNNVAKVSDFGLAKNIYQYGNYVKKGEGPLPVKWMAVESIGKGIFSLQSDVWSFGVVLWEFFSLAETPYPGLFFDETFYKKLTEGYRMECPKAATSKMYQMMMDCWNADPLLRPSFADLAKRLGLLLENSLVDYYIEMNHNYVVMNSQVSEDYLTMCSPPTFENIVSNSCDRTVGTGQTNESYVPEKVNGDGDDCDEVK